MERPQQAAAGRARDAASVRLGRLFGGPAALLLGLRHWRGETVKKAAGLQEFRRISWTWRGGEKKRNEREVGAISVLAISCYRTPNPSIWTVALYAWGYCINMCAKKKNGMHPPPPSLHFYPLQQYIEAVGHAKLLEVPIQNPCLAWQQAPMIFILTRRVHSWISWDGSRGAQTSITRGAAASTRKQSPLQWQSSSLHLL